MFWPCVNFRGRYIRGAGLFLTVDILRRFFLDSLDHFLTVVHQTEIIITGSCALNMLLGNLYHTRTSSQWMYFCESWLDISPRKDRWKLIHRSPSRSRVSSVIENASRHFFDASRSDRPDESGHLQYYDCRQDFYDGRMRCYFVTPNSRYTAKTCAARTRSSSTGRRIELEHQGVTHLL
jgi:hypothetical protein